MLLDSRFTVNMKLVKLTYGMGGAVTYASLKGLKDHLDQFTFKRAPVYEIVDAMIEAGYDVDEYRCWYHTKTGVRLPMLFGILPELSYWYHPSFLFL